MEIIEQKSNLKISTLIPTSTVKSLKPSIGIKTRRTGILDWTYDEDNITYNQAELTYDGVVFYDIVAPHSLIKSLTPKLIIK